jgi:hypothetical protein
MARPPDPKLHAVWRDRVRRQQASGLTIAQFCAEECVARSKFRFRTFWRCSASGPAGIFCPGRSVVM